MPGNSTSYHRCLCGENSHKLNFLTCSDLILGRWRVEVGRLLERRLGDGVLAVYRDDRVQEGADVGARLGPRDPSPRYRRIAVYYMIFRNLD